MTDNPYELFELPLRYCIDKSVLRERLQKLQMATHPDRHVRDDAAARLQAANLSARINDAYQQLVDPVKRAEALARIRGVCLPNADSTVSDPVLLMQQMEAREKLASIERNKDIEALERFQDSILDEVQTVERQLDQLFEETVIDEDALHALLTRLRFLGKLKNECARVEAALDDGDW